MSNEHVNNVPDYEQLPVRRFRNEVEYREAFPRALTRSEAANSWEHAWFADFRARWQRDLRAHREQFAAVLAAI